jgi:cytochrome P450
MTETPVLNDPTLPEVLPYDPFDPTFHRDPYAVFRTIRAEYGSVVRTRVGLALLGYEDISKALRDSRIGRGDGLGAMEGMMPTDEGPRRAFMFMDPPDHTRIRSMVSKSFTPHMVERIRPKAQKFAAERLARAHRESGGGVVDLAPEIFRPLGAYAMNTMMGVPDELLDQCIELATDGGRGLDPEYTMPPESIAARDRLRQWMAEVSKDLIKLRRAEPRDDLMSELVMAEQEGDRLTETEVITTAMNIMLPGFSAPQALMGLAAFALLSHPEELAWFRANPDQVSASVEEMLRYDTSVQIINRTVLEPTEVAGHALEPGREVFMLLGAANRDPEAFTEPDRLDLDRPAKRNVGFGHGIHFCVAAPIAKLVTEVVLTELVSYNVELATDAPATNGALAIRSYAELPVRLR